MESTLLFIHGAGGNHRVWGFQRKFFKKALFLDLPGHYGKGLGRSSIDEYVEDVKNFCIEKGLNENVVMIGHSMGGAIVQLFALKYPECLKGIVLVSTGAKLKVAPVIFEILKKNYQEAIEYLIDLLFSYNAGEEIKQKALLELRKIRPEVVYGDFQACDKFDLMEEIHKICIPTLIIGGSEDVLTPIKYLNYLEKSIAISRLEVINGAGHMVMLERPDEFNEKVRNFLSELKAYQA
jgi:pimeloyl-ACP methyl ester carboxylesterase